MLKCVPFECHTAFCESPTCAEVVTSWGKHLVDSEVPGGHCIVSAAGCHQADE